MDEILTEIDEKVSEKFDWKFCESFEGFAGRKLKVLGGLDKLKTFKVFWNIFMHFR